MPNVTATTAGYLNVTDASATNATTTGNSAAVSYTHLDVYKRQASPVDFSAHFTRGAVQVSGVPYVVLQNDASEVCIKHITGVSVLRQSDHCVYQFLCRDIRSNGKQTYHLVCSHPLKEKKPSSTPHSPS